MKFNLEISMRLAGNSGANRGTVDHVPNKNESVEWESDIKLEKLCKKINK